MNEPLAILAVAHGADEHVSITRDSLRRVVDAVGLDEREVYDLVRQAVLATSNEVYDGFDIRVGGWQLDLPTAVARGVINGSVLASLLAATDQTSVPATVLSVVVPFVFDLQRVNISRSDRRVLAVLLEDPWGRGSIEAWYQKLPGHIRQELTMLEFTDVIDRLEDGGMVDLDDYDVVTVDQLSPRRAAALNLPTRRTK